MNRRQFSVIAGSAAALRLTLGPVWAQLVDKPADELKNGEFDWYPDRSPGGPVLIIVSLPEQLVHVYRNGVRIGASTCSTGKPGHSTPTGVFKILQKDKNHHSSTYNNAPMPNMNRLTWSGIALHAGQLPGYPASHGCVRLPKEFSALVFGVTRVGMTVVIADDASQPVSVTHPGMVLGDYAAREFNAVDTAIKATEYSEGHEPAPRSPSVVVSSADKSIAVFDNSTLAASGKVETPIRKSRLASGCSRSPARAICLTICAGRRPTSARALRPRATTTYRRCAASRPIRPRARRCASASSSE